MFDLFFLSSEPGLMYREVDLSDLIIPSETKTFPPLAEHVDASEEVHGIIFHRICSGLWFSAFPDEIPGCVFKIC